MTETTKARASNIKGIHHVGLSVSNIETAIALYTEAIALDLDSRISLSNRAAERASGFSHKALASATLKGPNGYLLLSQYEASVAGPADAIPVEGPGITHVCFQAPTQENIYERFNQRGATPVSRGDSPVDLGGYGVYYAYSRDTDGIMFEMEHIDNTKFEGPIWLSHVALVSSDLDALVVFYQNLFDIEPYRRTDNFGGPRADEVVNIDNVQIRAAWFNVGNMILELWEYTNPATAKSGEPLPYEKIGYNKIAFESANIQQDFQRMSKVGLEFLSEPVSSEVSTEVFFRDPDGNLISLIQPAIGWASVGQLKQNEWL